MSSEDFHEGRARGAWLLTGARGSHIGASLKTGIPPLAYVYKKRVYSKNRVLCPMRHAIFEG